MLSSWVKTNTKSYHVLSEVEGSPSLLNIPLVVPAKAGIHQTNMVLILTPKYDYILILFGSPNSLVRPFSPNEAGDYSTLRSKCR